MLNKSIEVSHRTLYEWSGIRMPPQWIGADAGYLVPHILEAVVLGLPVGCRLKAGNPLQDLQQDDVEPPSGPPRILDLGILDRESLQYLCTFSGKGTVLCASPWSFHKRA